MTTEVLILGGTGDAAELAERLSVATPLQVTTSLAGRTRNPRAVAGRVRVGGFGGAEGLRRYIEEAGINILIDATHPFAKQISAHAVDACTRCAIPRLQLRRAAWAAQPGDAWIGVGSMEEAAQAIDPQYKSVFVTTGQRELSLLPVRQEQRFVVRLVEEPTASLPVDATLILARGPFSEEDERQLMRENAIDLLVSKNSGGEATYAKISAARARGIPVVMIDAPAPEAGPTVDSVAAAHRWVMARAAADAAPDAR